MASLFHPERKLNMARLLWPVGDQIIRVPNDFWTFTSKQTDVGKGKKDLQKVMENLCEARKISISQIQKYLFPIQVNPVFQVLGTPPSKDANIDISKGMCLHSLHLAILNP